MSELQGEAMASNVSSNERSIHPARMEVTGTNKNAPHCERACPTAGLFSGNVGEVRACVRQPTNQQANERTDGRDVHTHTNKSSVRTHALHACTHICIARCLGCTTGTIACVGVAVVVVTSASWSTRALPNPSNAPASSSSSYSDANRRPESPRRVSMWLLYPVVVDDATDDDEEEEEGGDSPWCSSWIKPPPSPPPPLPADDDDADCTMAYFAGDCGSKPPGPKSSGCTMMPV